MQHTIRALGGVRQRCPARARLIEQRHDGFWGHAPAPMHIRDGARPTRDINIGDVDVRVMIADRRMAPIWRRHKVSVRPSSDRGGLDIPDDRS